MQNIYTLAILAAGLMLAPASAANAQAMPPPQQPQEGPPPAEPAPPGETKDEKRRTDVNPDGSPRAPTPEQPSDMPVPPPQAPQQR